MIDPEFGVAFRQLSGTVTALEVAIKVMILAHPDRKRLTRIWRTVLPSQIDQFMTHPSYAIAEQRDAINNMLANLSEFIEMELPNENSAGES